MFVVFYLLARVCHRSSSIWELWAILHSAYSTCSYEEVTPSFPENCMVNIRTVHSNVKTNPRWLHPSSLLSCFLPLYLSAGKNQLFTPSISHIRIQTRNSQLLVLWNFLITKSYTISSVKLHHKRMSRAILWSVTRISSAAILCLCLSMSAHGRTGEVCSPCSRLSTVAGGRTESRHNRAVLQMQVLWLKSSQLNCYPWGCLPNSETLIWYVFDLFNSQSPLLLK